MSTDWCRRIAVIGDLHVGSRVAPWAPFKTKESGWIYPNPAQEYLLECYYDYWKWVEDTGGHTDVILGGDLVDGANVKEYGRTLSSVELIEQRKNALAMLSPYCEDKRIFSVDGSMYHTGTEQSTDELLADELGAKYHDKILFLEVPETGHIICAYHKGRTGGIYKASALESECRALDCAIGRGDISHDVDLVLRFHAHYGLRIHYKHRIMVQCHAWKLWFPGNIGTVGYGDRIPSTGASVVEIYEDRIEVIDRVYPYWREYDKVRVA